MVYNYVHIYVHSLVIRQYAVSQQIYAHDVKLHAHIYACACTFTNGRAVSKQDIHTQCITMCTHIHTYIHTYILVVKYKCRLMYAYTY
jgi:hypothetical protein